MRTKTRSLSLALAAACLLSFSAAETAWSSYGGTEHTRPAEGTLRWMRDLLGLSDEQTARIRAIYEDTLARGKAIDAESGGSPEEERQRLEALDERANEEVEAVLTARQKVKLEAEIRRERDGGGGATRLPHS